MNTESFNSIVTNKLKKSTGKKQFFAIILISRNKILKAEIYLLLVTNKLESLTEIGNNVHSKDEIPE